MNEALVSICTPCYNHERYISDYLKGLLSQTYPRLELIIIDDCSGDRSMELLQEALPLLEEKFERVKLIQNKKNLGINKTCNLLFHEARGEYIKQTASDDIMRPNCIMHLVQMMEKDPNVLIGIGNAVSIPDTYHFGDTFAENKKILDIKLLKSYPNLHDRLLCGNIVNVGKLFRRKVFDVCGYYDENLAFEDWDFLLTYTKNHRILFTDEVMVLYRFSITSLSRYMNAQDYQERKKRFCKMCFGGIQILKKHLKDLPEEKQNALIREKLIGNYFFQMDNGALDLQQIIICYMKQHNIRLPNKYEKYRYKIKTKLLSIKCIHWLLPYYKRIKVSIKKRK